MIPIIEQMLQQYENGTVNRRELICGIAAVAAAASVPAAATAQDGQPVFQATHLNHIALRVTDVQKSKEFYQKMLGMTPTRESDSSCFLTFGNDFLALFKGDEARMDHYCYSIENYDVEKAAAKLRELDIEPRVTSGRIYFPDPDGLVVQLAETEHTP